MSLVEAFGWLAFYVLSGLIPFWIIVGVLTVSLLCVGLYNEGRVAIEGRARREA